jgi:hypothetical protein
MLRLFFTIINNVFTFYLGSKLFNSKINQCQRQWTILRYPFQCLNLMYKHWLSFSFLSLITLINMCVFTLKFQCVKFSRTESYLYFKKDRSVRKDMYTHNYMSIILQCFLCMTSPSQCINYYAFKFTECCLNVKREITDVSVKTRVQWCRQYL